MRPLSIDLEATRWLAAHRTAGADALSHLLMWLGSPGPGLSFSVVVVVAVCLWRRRKFTIVLVGLAAALATLVGDALKAWIARPRPQPPLRVVDTVGCSMPSTSAAVCAAVLLVLTTLQPTGKEPARERLRRIGRAVLVVLHLAVCWAIVYLGAHWLSDVFAGTVLGVAVAGLLLRVDTIRRGRCRRRAADLREPLHATT